MLSIAFLPPLHFSQTRSETAVNSFGSSKLYGIGTSDRVLHVVDQLSRKSNEWTKIRGNSMNIKLLDVCGCLQCSRRRMIESLGLSLILNYPANALDLVSNPSEIATVIMNEVHPPRGSWYEEFYAYSMDKGMKSYELEIAGYKEKLLSHLRENSTNILEMGVGTGPNFKYYATNSSLSIVGIDPNKQMKKYAQAAAELAGLSATQFNFIQAVGEALPVNDSSMDAVIGTLVLCSVKDVNMVLKEVIRVLKPGGIYIFIEHVAAPGETMLRLFQTVLDPLQQLISDGCHLTRDARKYITYAGFSDVKMNSVFLSSVSLISPHIYGIAYK